MASQWRTEVTRVSAPSEAGGGEAGTRGEWANERARNGEAVVAVTDDFAEAHDGALQIRQHFQLRKGCLRCRPAQAVDARKWESRKGGSGKRQEVLKREGGEGEGGCRRVSKDIADKVDGLAEYARVCISRQHAQRRTTDRDELCARVEDGTNATLVSRRAEATMQPPAEASAHKDGPFLSVGATRNGLAVPNTPLAASCGADRVWAGGWRVRGCTERSEECKRMCAHVGALVGR